MPVVLRPAPRPRRRRSSMARDAFAGRAAARTPRSPPARARAPRRAGSGSPSRLPRGRCPACARAAAAASARRAPAASRDRGESAPRAPRPRGRGRTSRSRSRAAGRASAESSPVDAPVFSRRISAACVRGPRPAASSMSKVRRAPPRRAAAVAAARPASAASASSSENPATSKRTSGPSGHVSWCSARASPSLPVPGSPSSTKFVRNGSLLQPPHDVQDRGHRRMGRGHADERADPARGRRADAQRPRLVQPRQRRSAAGALGGAGACLMRARRHPRLMPSRRSMVAWSAAGKRYFSNSPEVTQRQSATRTAVGSASPRMSPGTAPDPPSSRRSRGCGGRCRRPPRPRRRRARAPRA